MDVTLFEGEELSFSQDKKASEIKITDDQINHKYLKGEVRIVTEQARYPLNSIKDMVASDDYQLNPDFQRRHRWSIPKKSKLIESFIMNVPIPPIFLYEDRFGHYEVMDGLQRLSTINDFYSDRFKLMELEEWPELNGKTYSTLPDQIKKGIDRRYLSSIILLKETAKTEFEEQRLKQIVFERLNSGGVRLEPQESRNAIYHGRLNNLCIEKSRNIYLCRTWDIPEPTEEESTFGDYSDTLLSNTVFSEMLDVELVLRFFAYRQKHKLHKSTTLRGYFDAFLRNGNEHFSTAVLEGLGALFEDTIKLCYEIFGETAFWLYRRRGDSWNFFARPTLAVYDSMMYALSKRLEDRDLLIARSLEIKDRLKRFYMDNYEAFEGRNVNPSVLIKRDVLFDEFFEDFLR